jgi:hypothetical protein
MEIRLLNTYRKRGRPKNIDDLTNCGYENNGLLHFSNIVQFNLFSQSRCIKQSISNKTLGMGTTRPSVERV